MKKQISMLLATACAASLLAACGGSGSTAASASAADSTAASSEKTAADAASLYENAQKPDKLVWWVHDGMHQEDGSEQWIADFDAKTGIDLELDFIDNNEYTKKLELAYASDTVPDTFDLNGETLGNYAAQGAIADLTDLVHESGLYDKVDKNRQEPVGCPDRQRQDLRRPPRDAFRYRDLCPQGLAGPPRHGRAHHL